MTSLLLAFSGCLLLSLALTGCAGGQVAIGPGVIPGHQYILESLASASTGTMLSLVVDLEVRDLQIDKVPVSRSEVFLSPGQHTVTYKVYGDTPEWTALNLRMMINGYSWDEARRVFVRGNQQARPVGGIQRRNWSPVSMQFVGETGKSYCLSDMKYLPSPLFEAARKGNAGAVRDLVAGGSDVNLTTNYGWTPLVVAAKNGKTDVVGELLSLGANRNIKEDGQGMTALLLAAKNGHEDIVRKLMDRGAEINTPVGVSALSAAAENGQTEVVRELLARGAEANEKDGRRRTALMLAAGNGHREVVRELLSKGADVSAKDSRGSSAISVAKNEAVIKELQASGAAPAAPKPVSTQIDKTIKGWIKIDKREALFVAAGYGRADIVKDLLEQRMDVNYRSTSVKDSTALINAATNGHHEVVKVLLARGADIQAKDRYGWTACMHAAARGHRVIYDELLARGAQIDLTTKNEYGTTVSMTAAEGGRADILKELLARGRMSIPRLWLLRKAVS